MDDSKLSNQTSTTTAKSIPIIDLTQCEDPNQIHFPSPHKHSKETLINNFIQRTDEILKKITQIYEQAEDESTKTTELQRLIFIKPRLQEAIHIQNLLKNTDSDFFKLILQDLTSDIELSHQCLQNLQNFYHTQKSLPRPEKMMQASHVIGSTWQQIYQLSIYDPVLISEVSKLEWIFRALEVLNHNRTDSSYPFIEYCGLLKKAALASQSEEIMASQFYERIEEELERYQFLTKRVKFLSKPDLVQKMDAEQVQELLQELKDFGFGMKQEIEYIEGVLKKAFKIGERFRAFLKKKALVSTNDLTELLLDIRNSPVRFQRIQGLLSKFFNDQKEQVKVVLQDAARRIIEGNRKLPLRYLKDIEDSDKINDAARLEAKETSEAYWQEVQRIGQYGAKLIQDLHTFRFEDFSMIRKQITEKEYEHIKGELWLAQMRLLQIFCERFLKPSNPITFEELHSFLPEIEDYVNSLPSSKRAPFDQQIGFLHRFLREVKTWIKSERDKQEIVEKETLNKILYGFIDVTKEIVKPKKQQQQVFNLNFHSTGIQLKEPDLESLNGKRSRVDNQTQEINPCEKIEKKMKSNKIQLVFDSLGGARREKSQPEIIIIEDSDNLLPGLKKEARGDYLNGR